MKNTNTEIHTVSSHIQALLQTRDHLSRLYPNTGRLEVEDTAYAAEMLAEGKLADDRPEEDEDEEDESNDTELEKETQLIGTSLQAA